MPEYSEWRCDRLLELDHLIAAEERQKLGARQVPDGPGHRASRRRRLEIYAAKMRAGLTPATKHLQFKFTDPQRKLIAEGVPPSFFKPPERRKR